MRDRNDSLTRRNALKKGGLTVTALGVGIPVISGNAVAETDISTMAVDAPPVISTDQRGTVVAAVYPGGDMNPAEVIDHGGFDGFKLGPDTDEIGDFDDVALHADSIRHRLLPTGNLGVFFDSSTAETWFTSDDDEAKISAVGTDSGGGTIIAWGSDPVSVRATPSPN